MKTLHLSIIICTMIIFLGFGLESAHADNASGVYVQNIQVKPSVIKVGDTFTVTSTFVNNSTSTIVLNGGTCVPVRYDTAPLFDVKLDDHAKYNTQNWTCAGVGLSKILDIGKNITGTSPDPTVTYVAIKPGTSSVTVTYSYHTINQTDPTQSGAEQTISKTFQFMISGNKTSVQPSLRGGSSFTFDKISPLEQFKSGIDAQKITCSQDLHLIIKAEDGSPACVKPETANILYQRGWAVSSLKNFANLTGQGLDSFTNISENDCEQFNTISVKPHNGTVIPALLTYSNSTGCARLTYTINYNYNDTSNGSIAWPRIANFSLLHIDTLKYTSNGDSFGVTSGKDFTNSFKITAVPATVDLANFPIGSNFTVTYIIRPLPNATGFYDESIPEPVCFVYPLAVNYNADQVNSSDFSKGLISMQNHSCIYAPYELSRVEISGMSYKEMILP